HLLFVLSAILYSSVVLRDELDNRTITYLFLRPVPKWLVGLCKVGGAILLSGVPVLLFLILHSIMLKISLLPFLAPLMLQQFFFCSFFCLLSLIIRHPILWAIIFTIMLPPDLPGALKLFSISFHQQNLYGEIFRNLEVAPLSQELFHQEVPEDEITSLDKSVFSKPLWNLLSNALGSEKKAEKKALYFKTRVTLRSPGKKWLVTDEVTHHQFLLRKKGQELYFYNTLYQDPDSYFPETSWLWIFYGFFISLLGVALLTQFREFKLGIPSSNK
ncbi:MAG: hypothetical protein AABZ60_22865, partial [Planctomycetota bacterium]